jgi:hypothetical protein
MPLRENHTQTIVAFRPKRASIENDIEFLPLQAADLNAWWIRKMATEKRQITAFPWKPRRQIPGVQFHYDERIQLRVREEIISRLRA